MLCFCVVSPSFLVWFFFPPFFTVVLGSLLLLFFSPLLFWVRSSLSPICSWGATSQLCFPWAFGRQTSPVQRFCCPTMLLFWHQFSKAVSWFLAYTQQLCSIWPTKIIRAKIWRIDITWRILPSCITALPTIAKHLINGFHCTFIFDLKSGNLECSWCRAKVDTLLFGSYHPRSLYTCIILPLAMASCTFLAFLVSAYERGFHVFNLWCLHPLSSLDLVFVHLHFIQCLYQVPNF